MLELPTHLPLFSPESLVLPEAGKQDRVEIDIGKWAVTASNREEAEYFFDRIGSPPTIPGSRLRQDHHDMYGWIFNRLHLGEWTQSRKCDVRASALEIEQEGGAPRVIPPPLFAGACKWQIAEDQLPHDSSEPSSSESSDLETTERHAIIFGTLQLSLNPTRFFRHQPVTYALPGGMQARPLPAAPYHERSYDRADNWLPFIERRRASQSPERWPHQVSRYFSAIEGAFEQELSRVCEPLMISHVRGNRSYNVKEVETYWEWVSPDPLKVVADIVPHLRTFSRRFRGQRIYEAFEDFIKDDLRILRIQTAPGEWLKIYAKTNLRIRIEITHKFKGRKDAFQFPRDEDGHRSKKHTFDSLQGVQQFFRRLQTRAATMVNKFLTHLGKQSQIVPSHIAAYDALFKMARATPNDYATGFSLLSQLLHEGGIPAGGDAAKQQAVDALRAFGVIERNEQGSYLPTASYRHAFQMLRVHANFTLLTARVRTRNNTPQS